MVLNIHFEIEDNKLNTTGTSNTEGEFKIWFWNKSANKSNSDIKEEENKDKKEKNENKEEKDNNQKKKKFKTQKTVNLDVPKIEIKWNKQRENKL